MDLVDDVNSLFDVRGSINDLVENASDIIDLVVLCRVHFKDVCRRAVKNCTAGGALAARVTVFRILAVYCTREDLRAGGLTRSARAAEKIGMAKKTALGLVFENIGNMLLTANRIEVGRSPFTI